MVSAPKQRCRLAFYAALTALTRDFPQSFTSRFAYVSTVAGNYRVLTWADDDPLFSEGLMKPESLAVHIPIKIVLAAPFAFRSRKLPQFMGRVAGCRCGFFAEIA